MLHPVDSWTWIWGAWGLLVLAISTMRRERDGMELGAMMFSTWGVSTWALMWFGATDQAFYVTTWYDAVAGIGLALWMSLFGASGRGKLVVALFATEMLVRLPAASYGWWNVNLFYVITCVIYGLQVAIGGWRGLMDTVTDWCAAFRPRRRVPSRGS